MGSKACSCLCEKSASELKKKRGIRLKKTCRVFWEWHVIHLFIKIDYLLSNVVVNHFVNYLNFYFLYSDIIPQDYKSVQLFYWQWKYFFSIWLTRFVFLNRTNEKMLQAKKLHWRNSEQKFFNNSNWNASSR